ncbi:MAG: DNA cytosine methyltransferase [Elusimicrobia bacterium]|nr:DNA cytosine methyltransferase [Elusimicrobiota bacterium]
MADLILGHEPIAAVEWDPYCCQILRERAAEGWFPGLQVFEGDIRLFDASAWKGRVDCVSAGFPCQPHSVAGKRRGALDDRNLWPEVVRVLGEIRPRWFFGENVPGLVSNGFIGTVLGDLALLGYDARWTCLGADQVGAPHRRDRWWCLANAESREIDERKPRDMAKEAGRGQRFNPLLSPWRCGCGRPREWNTTAGNTAGSRTRSVHPSRCSRRRRRGMAGIHTRTIRKRSKRGWNIHAE